MNARVRAVLRKELREFRRNKLVVGTMAVLPLIFFAIPTAGVLSLNAGTAPDAIRAAVGSALLGFFLVPLMLPTVIAGYAVVGEREQGTLEPVLTTPVSREELLTGKALAAIAPSVAMAYALFALFVIVVGLFAVREVVTLVLEPAIVVAIALFTPLLAAFSIWGRVGDLGALERHPRRATALGAGDASDGRRALAVRVPRGRADRDGRGCGSGPAGRPRPGCLAGRLNALRSGTAPHSLRWDLSHSGLILTDAPDTGLARCIGGGGRESNPPESLRPHVGFEDRGAHQEP
jgi:ABC-type transport system involved in cytochrome c biogenesis permease component